MGATLGAAVNQSTVVPGHSRLAVRRLTLTDFRCYQALRFECDGSPVVLVGPNGAGKTNLLEAISCLAPGRGLRRARLADIAGRRPPVVGQTVGDTEIAQRWAVAAEIDGAFGPVSLGVGWAGAGEDGKEKRETRIDGQPVGNQSALSEHIGVVWLTPAQDRLFIEAPSGRRQFLDSLVFAFDPAHAGRVQAFDKGRRDRTKLLREGRVDAVWLAAVERGMAERAVAIAAARLDLVARLVTEISAADGPFPKPLVEVRGLLENWLLAMPALDVEEQYRARLEADRPTDAEAGTAQGPHRSDLWAALGPGGPEAAQASTGEQKAVLIAMVLAHGRLLTRLRGAAPVMLLDEVVAHLDGTRRAALFESIRSMGAQVWLTGTEPELFAPLRDMAQMFLVKDATLTTTPIEEWPRG